MRQQPQNVLEKKCVRVVPNQSMTRVRTLADQSDRGRCSGRHFHCRLPSRASPIGSASISLIPLSLALLYTYALVTVNAQSLSKQRLPFLCLRAQLILETTRRYCLRLMFNHVISFHSIKSRQCLRNSYTRKRKFTLCSQEIF